MSAALFRRPSIIKTYKIKNAVKAKFIDQTSIQTIKLISKTLYLQ